MNRITSLKEDSQSIASNIRMWWRMCGYCQLSGPYYGINGF